MPMRKVGQIATGRRTGSGTALYGTARRIRALRSSSATHDEMKRKAAGRSKPNSDGPKAGLGDVRALVSFATLQLLEQQILRTANRNFSIIGTILTGTRRVFIAWRHDAKKRLPRQRLPRRRFRSRKTEL